MRQASPPITRKSVFPMSADVSNTLILIPAYNEAGSLTALLQEVREAMPGFPVLVVSDGSSDDSARVAAAEGARVLDLPCNLGVSGAVQAGFMYARDRGFTHVIRIDGDGQHPPLEIPKLMAVMAERGVDLVIGSRFLGGGGKSSNALRLFGIRGLSWFLSGICRAKVTDPTSGFMMINQVLLHYFAQRYPADYPEPEALALLRRQGYVFAEADVDFR